MHPSSERHVAGSATLFGLIGDDFGAIHELEAIELSAHGMRGRTHRPIREGALVSIGFESRVLTARRGIVRACEPVDNTFHVAIEMDDRQVA